jgi:hypothetical protein
MSIPILALRPCRHDYRCRILTLAHSFERSDLTMKPECAPPIRSTCKKCVLRSSVSYIDTKRYPSPTKWTASDSSFFRLPVLEEVISEKVARCVRTGFISHVVEHLFELLNGNICRSDFRKFTCSLALHGYSARCFNPCNTNPQISSAKFSSSLAWRIKNRI